MRRVVGDLVAGAAAGALATVPMSAVMWGAQEMGRIRKQPPGQITETALHRLDVNPPDQAENGLAVVNHLAFGALAGGVFGAVHRTLPATGGLVPAGVAYGLGLWATAYQKLIPALGLMPRAGDDRPSRASSMAAAHVVFGAALATALSWWRDA